jgi:glycine dehydrogenase subunit 1
MPFIPHTEDDVKQMLSSIDARSVEDLFDEIPAGIRSAALKLPPALSEAQVSRLMDDRAAADGRYLNFVGAGAYEHHIPAAVWQIVTRGEFYTAYTPYQAEASQGTLQVLYEYQTMMASLTGLHVSNASLYDGGSALGEAVLMAVRAHKSSRRVLMPTTVNPAWAAVTRTLVKNQGIELVSVPYCAEKGAIMLESPKALEGRDFAALVIPQPNFFGMLEDVDTLTDWAHAQGMAVIGAVNPTTLTLLKPPGQWGESGADMACGDGQPLGLPLSGGGPYFGFLTCKDKLVRQMPGRIIGRTVDKEGSPGFVLTLQAREQHIRRSKATSNICSNQGLMVTAATLYLSLLGPQGLRNVARASHANTVALLDKLCAVPGVRRVFKGPCFHEAVLRFDMPVKDILRPLRAQGIVGGFDLSRDYPELGNALLVCATETRSAEDLAAYAEHLARILSKRAHVPAGCEKCVPNENSKW